MNEYSVRITQRIGARLFFIPVPYTANPIACAVAAANLQMWNDPDTLNKVQKVAQMQELKLTEMAQSEALTNLRRTGTIAAMEIQVKDSGYLSEIGTELYLRFQKSGVLLRPLGNTIYVLPPYCVTAEDLDTVYGVISENVTQLTR